MDDFSDSQQKFGRGSVLVASHDPMSKHNTHTRMGQSVGCTRRLMRIDTSQSKASSAVAQKLGWVTIGNQPDVGVFRWLRLNPYTCFLKLYEIGTRI